METYDDDRARAEGHLNLRAAWAEAMKSGWANQFEWPKFDKKDKCSCCGQKREYYQVTSTSRRRAGSYNRAGSGVTTKVCWWCVTFAVDGTRQAIAENRSCGLDGEIGWSWAATDLGIYWHDLPRRTGQKPIAETTK